MHLTSISSRFRIGIDLGTTNTALAYFDTQKPKSSIQIFRVPQAGRHGHEEFLTLLPSFLYLEEPEGLKVGMWAKVQGALIPTRLIQSAKSWLSNPAANRKEKILPFEAAEPERRLSPVTASAHYLMHLREMWNRQFAKGDPSLEMEEQEIVLTVPASFDEIARTLTVEAAKLAGLKKIILLEEPQAAFYNWLMEHGKLQFKAGDSILVCDVGGGTTDFSLIDVMATDEGIELRRMAVGKHLLLGGDNMDAALCHFLETRLGQELETAQHLSLLHQARTAKEKLLSGEENQTYSIFLSGKGSAVVGGSLSTEISYEETTSLLLDGFFGLYPFEEALKLQKGSGIRQMGLAFEPEPSITKHLAHFLYKNERKLKPTYLLFNGGAMKPPLFQKRIIDSLESWYGGKPIHVLESSSLDLAVAKGAAYFGTIRQQKEACIGGGIPRSYYLKIDLKDGSTQALTLLPRGAVEGSRSVSSRSFSLIPNQPVSFQLYHSHTRLKDQSGDIIPIDEEELTPLPPLQTLCQYGKKEQREPIPVLLEIDLTAIGTLELWLLSQKSEHRWKLEFQLRGTAQEERAFEKRFADETLDTASLGRAREELVNAFAVGAAAKLNGIMAGLEKLLEKDRRMWPPSVLRTLFEALLELSEKRLLSQDYEGRFWNLAGFFLRPGLGYPLDDFRIKQIWKLILTDLKRVKGEEVQLQHWICYRRIAAGLSKGQQGQLFNELIQQKVQKKGYSYAEHLRALAALELVETSAKTKLGNVLVKKLCEGKGEPCDYWALGRIGARQLFHGTAANVIPRPLCEEWIHKLLKGPAAQSEQLPFTLAMLARKTNTREIDLSPSLLEKIAPLLASEQDLLFSERELTVKEQERFFGDSLPSGLTLTSV